MASGAGKSGHAHAPATVGGQPYAYDANGNTTSGGGRTYVWDADNRPTSITGPDGVTETYGYDADGGRVVRTRAGVTTVSLGGAWEQDVQAGAGTTTRAFVALQDRAIAQRERVASPVSDTTIYLHGDHLGSVSAATSGTGAALSRQAYTPWGERRAGGGDITQTTRDFTGQKRDGTGLLFYGARYYDPKLARFTSADTVAPDKAEPQSRNRYSYVLNNPLKFIDPTGHCTSIPRNRAESEENEKCREFISYLSGWGIDFDWASINNWQSNLLEDVWEGARRMSVWLGLGADGRLFRERILNGRNVTITRVTEFQGCQENVFACSSGDLITFTKLGLTGSDPDNQWALNQKTVIHELSHVWDFRNHRDLQNGLEVARGPGGDFDHAPTPVQPGREPTAEEDFAEAVAYYVMEGSPIQGRREFVNSARWYYVACVAQGRSAGQCTGSGEAH